MLFFSCINKLTITEDRVRLPLYEENEYSINTTNPAFEGQPLPPPPSYSLKVSFIYDFRFCVRAIRAFHAFPLS